jgi:MSHA biogenesis protein MshP
MACSARRQPSWRGRERGFGIVVGLFLVIGIAALGIAISFATAAQNRNQGLDVAGVDAYYAARAGVDFGVYQVFKTPTSCSTTTLTPAAWGARLSVTVVCTSNGFTDGGALTVYEITATACNRPAGGACPGTAGEGYVERELRATVEGP